MSQTLTVNALTQTITFAAIPAKTVGNADFAPGATASSSLAISYTSSNTSVATILNGNIHIVGAGTSVITAAQSGNTTYAAAISVSQTLTVNALAQTITFAAIPAKIVGDADFNPGATATSGLAISYTSSNISVATILNGNIHIVGAGTSVITAAQSGNTSYSAATSVLQTLTVTKTYTYSPTSTTVLSGSVNSGTFGNLATNNASYYVVNSTTTGTRTVSWYGSVKITQAPSSVSKLTLTYDGKNSASKTQILYLYNWVTAAWVQIDSRTVSTTDVLITNTQNAPANYISSLGEIRLRVYSSAGTANYTCSGDWMQFAIQSTSALRTTSSLPIVNTTETISSQTALFPNPSYSNSELKYFVAKNSKVSINIYNANGIKVKELATDKNESIGIHTQHIESSNLTNGVYFIKLLVDGKLETIKLIVRH